MIKCISFDFDRTLAHVTPLTHQLIPKLLEQEGISITVDNFVEQCEFLRENLPQHIADRFHMYGTMSPEERKKFILEYNKERIELVDLSSYVGDKEELKEWLINEIAEQQKKVLYEDCTSVISKLKELGLKIFILSGNHSDGITKLLEEGNLLHHFEEIITVDKYHSHKSKNFEYLLRYSNVKPDEILHIGDDRRTDGLAPTQFGINVLIIERPDQLIINRNVSEQFQVITELVELFDFL